MKLPSNTHQTTISQRTNLQQRAEVEIDSDSLIGRAKLGVACCDVMDLLETQWSIAGGVQQSDGSYKMAPSEAFDEVENALTEAIINLLNAARQAK